MTTTNFEIGQKVTYTVCNSVYTGLIVKIKQKSLIVIDDEYSMTLWKAGYAVGSEIAFIQVK